MALLPTALLLVFVTAVAADAWSSSGLVPAVVSNSPRGTATVRFGGNAASLGNTLTEGETWNQPSVSLSSSGNYFTIVMVDPDAPSRGDPSAAQWLHLLATNVPRNGNELNVNRGDVLMNYEGPTPPSGTGPHRYAVLVFKQNGYVGASAPYARNNFDVKSFASRNRLGSTPEAGNFFYVRG